MISVSYTHLVINGNTEGNFAGARAQRPQIPDAIPEDVQEVVKNFRMIAGEASGIIKGYLKSARLSLGGDNRLLIVLPDSLAASVVGREDHVEELEKLIEERIGKPPLFAIINPPPLSSY